jgi:hypothetical protein
MPPSPTPTPHARGSWATRLQCRRPPARPRHPLPTHSQSDSHGCGPNTMFVHLRPILFLEKIQSTTLIYRSYLTFNPQPQNQVSAPTNYQNHPIYIPRWFLSGFRICGTMGVHMSESTSPSFPLSPPLFHARPPPSQVGAPLFPDVSGPRVRPIHTLLSALQARMPPRPSSAGLKK